MSSTQMDFSPIVIDRKQETASWPEGDIDQLAARDKNRYQKRKSAIIEYFQSDLSVAEISSRHRLSAADALEPMARRCCMQHEDGRLWGFRALVPGVKAVDARASASAVSAKQDDVVEAKPLATDAAVESADADWEDEDDDEDTAERKAIVLTKVAEPPQMAASLYPAKQAGPLVVRTKTSPASESVNGDAAREMFECATTLEPSLASASVAEVLTADETVTQEAFPLSANGKIEPADGVEEQVESPGAVSVAEATVAEKLVVEEAIPQEAFPAIAQDEKASPDQEVPPGANPVLVNEAGTATVAEVAQESSSSVTDEAAQAAVEETVAQLEFPTPVAEILPEETVAQQEFPAPAVEVLPEETVAQQEFPAPAVENPPSTESGTVEATAEAAQESSSSVADEAAQTAVEETVAQLEFPVPAAEVLPEETVAQQEFPALASPDQSSGEPELDDEDDELEGEPTGKLIAIRPARQVEASELETAETSKLTNEQTGAEVSEMPAEVNVLQEEKAGETAEEHVEQAEAADARQEVEEASGEGAEQNTAEVARIAREDRLNRVAAVETIKVPAAMLEALEKADRELQATSEVATDTTTSTDEAVASTDVDKADHLPMAVPPSVQEQTQPDGDEESDKDKIAAVQTHTLDAWRRDSRQLTQAPVLKPPTQSLVEDSRYRITGSQVAIKRALLRRWGKKGRQEKYQSWVRIISAAVIVSILVILLIPLGVGLVGYNAYTNIENIAKDGVDNLLSLQELIPANKSDLLSALDTKKLAAAKGNLEKAQNDFLQLQDIVNRPDVESLLQQFAPQYSSKLDMARRLVQVALDVSRMGQELIGVAQMGASVLHGSGSSLLSGSSSTPLISANDVNDVEAALVHAQYYISDIQTQMSQVNLASVPFGTTAQKAELGKYLNQIPQAQSTIAQVQSLVGPVAWMLGVGQTRHFLVQTLDRGELRPSGGFEGQYGILTLQNGRMSPFSLRDITLLDYASNGNELGATPPPQYGWMNFGNFGVRDANLSADFPTTAKIVMSYFQAEGGGPLDGIIQVTPVVIEQFLQITGPLKVPDYNDTVTAQNLEAKLHAYQQDPRLIAEQQQVTGQTSKSTRKAFTNLVGTLLLDRAKHLSTTQLLSFGKLMLNDLKSRDVQIYMNNPVAEQWLTQNGDDGAMPHYTNGTDGFMVVQANISISKAAQYVKSTFKDNVTLDAQGGATHNVTITLNYQQTGPVYGYNTYADYMRVYAPANAQLISAYGFNTGSVLCTPGKPRITSGKNGGSSDGSGSYVDAGVTITGCGQYYNTFPDTNARYCPDGNYQLGYDGMAAKAWPVQNLGGPSSQHSDLPGYAMWGGLTLTPKNCISTITLSWYVPHVVQNKAGQSPYQMIVGHQAGWPDVAQVSIDTSALKGVKPLQYNQTIDVDTLIALAPLPLPNSRPLPGSTPTPAVTPTATAKKP